MIQTCWKLSALFRHSTCTCLAESSQHSQVPFHFRHVLGSILPISDVCPSGQRCKSGIVQGLFWLCSRTFSMHVKAPSCRISCAWIYAITQKVLDPQRDLVVKFVSVCQHIVRKAMSHHSRLGITGITYFCLRQGNTVKIQMPHTKQAWEHPSDTDFL